MFLITLWIYRTAVVGLPAPSALPSLFLPLGPCGQGSFGIMLLGIVVRELAYKYGIGFAITRPEGNPSESILWLADGVYAAGLIMGLILWGLGLVWYTLGMTITLHHIARNRVYLSHKSFSVGWTGYTFPIGVWATATTTLATELDSPAFKVLGTIVSLQVVFHWMYVFSMGCWKASTGALFVAPELGQWDHGRPPLRWSKAGTREMV
jgi:tellurite resistance protein TehA-like permease